MNLQHQTFPLIKAMGMAPKQNLAGAGREWLYSPGRQKKDSWPTVLTTRMLELNYELMVKGNWHYLIKSLSFLLYFDFYFQHVMWTSSFFKKNVCN